MRQLIQAGLVALVLGWAVAPAAGQATPQPRTVYSSLPLVGKDRVHARAIDRGARLALEESGATVQGQAVRYVSLSDADASAGGWTPERVVRNARRAAVDPSTLGYIGEFNSGASAISIPVLDEAGVVQISPSNTAIGLTRGGTGTLPGEPDKYYPTGSREYFRIAPTDRVQGGALAVAMRESGCRRVALLTDGELFGEAIGTYARRDGRRLGLRFVIVRKLRASGRDYRRLTRRLRSRRVGCVLYSGIAADDAVALYRALAAAMPRAGLFGSDGIAEPAFTDPRRGGIPARIGRRIQITTDTLPPSAHPPAGQAFFARYSARYHDPQPDPYAIRGYEAMRLLLDAAEAAGPDRIAMARWLADMPARSSPFGDYRFDFAGDTTLRMFGVYRIRHGRLSYSGTVEAP